MDSNSIRSRLQSKYILNEKGMWKILGEDSNADMGGHHSQPELGYVTGTYANVVEYALRKPSFCSWGAGGDIVKITPIVDVDLIDTAKVVELFAERKKLVNQIKDIEDELLRMTGSLHE